MTDELPDAWENPIRSAADKWSDETDIDISENSSSSNIIWKGSIPLEWWSDCPPASSGACTWIEYTNYHLTRSRMVFNWDHDYNTAWFKCFLGIGLDVETSALHEFGHFGGYLSHSSDSNAVMNYDVSDCERDLKGHDIYSMDTNYGYSH